MRMNVFGALIVAKLSAPSVALHINELAREEPVSKILG